MVLLHGNSYVSQVVVFSETGFYKITKVYEIDTCPSC